VPDIEILIELLTGKGHGELENSPGCPGIMFQEAIEKVESYQPAILQPST
jgi:hypothetical protein